MIYHTAVLIDFNGFFVVVLIGISLWKLFFFFFVRFFEHETILFDYNHNKLKLYSIKINGFCVYLYCLRSGLGFYGIC